MRFPILTALALAHLIAPSAVNAEFSPEFAMERGRWDCTVLMLAYNNPEMLRPSVQDYLEGYIDGLEAIMSRTDFRAAYNEICGDRPQYSMMAATLMAIEAMH